MEEKSITILSVSELLHRSRPLTGASLLYTSSNSNTKLNSSGEKQLKPSDSFNSKTLNPLNYPTLLIGTLNLPTHKNLSVSTSNSEMVCPKVSCFSFSDHSSTVCCDILDLHPRVIGKKVRVLAWNFIPFKSGGGFLEIIKWGFEESLGFLFPCSLGVESFPLNTGFLVNAKDDCIARYYVHGVIESVSPVTLVPCSHGPKNDNKPSLICGFLTKLFVCACKLCSSRNSVNALHRFPEGENFNQFTGSVIVYFYGFASCWHPVVSRLIGSFVSLMNLRKKLVFIGKDESQLMYVTSEKSSLGLPRLRDPCLSFQKNNILGKGECGEYTGTVTGIYMQGKVVELDQEVILLPTDQLLSFTHSLRVGAIVSVRNVHFVNPNFTWTKVLVLGACYKTSILVKSFSPMKTGCNIYRQSESLLGKFIDSLSFSAKLWVLLTISCLKKKFSVILPEKDILGSKHKQGVAQKYCTSCLPSLVCRSRHGVFTEFCKHDSCGCGLEPNCGHLKLVVPISSFISHCEATWTNMTGRNSDSDRMSYNNQKSSRICGSTSYNQPTKRFLQSKDIDVVLLGNLKNSPPSGSLQLIDATGSINIVIPDLPSSWNINSIYQVYDFTVVIEGVFEESDHLESVSSKLFSCRDIFKNAIFVGERKLAIYLYCQLREELSRNRPLSPGFHWKEKLEDISGRFHMLIVTHKFPVLQKFQGDQIITNRSRFSIFAEAIILPWDLLYSDKNGDYCRTAISEAHSSESEEHFVRSHEERAKRCKTIEASRSCSPDAGNDLVGSSNHCFKYYRMSFEDKLSFGSSYPLEIPCVAAACTTVSCNSRERSKTSFCCRKDNAKITCFKSGAKKVLLEFEQDSFAKFQSLKIGGYYIIKHHNEDLYCTINYSNDVGNSKIFITPRSSLLSISFSSQEAFLETDQTPSSLIHESGSSNKGALSEDSSQIELPNLNFMDTYPQLYSDVKIHLPPDSSNLLDVNMNIWEQGFVKPVVSFETINKIFERMTGSVQSLRTSNLDFILPEGDLISLHGHVVAFHSADRSSLAAHSGRKSSTYDWIPSFFKGVTKSVCIHVLVDDHMVKIFGSLSAHAFPVGFGAGVDATFYRILVTGGRNELLLTPTSFIVINSVMIDDQYKGRYDSSSATLEFYIIPSSETKPVSLISETEECFDHMPLHLHCKVIAIYVLVLEKNRKIVQSHPKAYGSHAVNIPLAGFILDDGSSTCCCWANNETALTLLQLHRENFYESTSNSKGSKKAWLTNPISSNVDKLDKILQQHRRVIMRNFGSTSDSFCQDIIISVDSDKNINHMDEEFLKFNVLNACFRSTLWTVAGSVIDSDATKKLENQLTALDMPNLGLRNIWGTEVFDVNSATVARNIVKELGMN